MSVVAHKDEEPTAITLQSLIGAGIERIEIATMSIERCCNMKLSRNLALILLLASLLPAPGCGKKDDQAKQEGPTTEQIEAEAQKMDNDQLWDNAQKAKAEIIAARVKVNELVLSLQNLTPPEKAAGEAQRINAELDELQKSMQLSKVKFTTYYNKLVEKGVDVTELRQ
jgi:hypothetical protein